MNKFSTIAVILLVIFSNMQIVAKSRTYELKNHKIGWNKLLLDDSLLDYINSAHSQIRLIHIDDKDTNEVPFFVEYEYKIDSTVYIPINIVDTVSTNGRKYFIVKSDTTKIISCLEFGFGRKKFESKMCIEGSDNNEDWSVISDNVIFGSRYDRYYPISSESIYDMSKFYRYYRFGIDTNSNLLENIRYQKIYASSPKYKRLKIRKISQRENKKKKLTIVEFKLNYNLPINMLRLDLKKNFDDIRKVELHGLVDSTNTVDGIKLNYKLLETFNITNSDTNKFIFSYPEHYQQYKLQIYNGNGKRTEVTRLKAFRFEYVLKSMHTDSGSYYVEFNKEGTKQFYEIEKYKNRIPNNINEMELGKRVQISGIVLSGSSSVSEKKLILAAISLVVLIFVIITLQRIKKSKKRKLNEEV